MGDSLCFAEIEIVDAHGNPVLYAEAELSATVEGSAVLLSLGSARPKTEENYTKGIGTTHQGRLLAVVCAGVTPGKAVLHISSRNLGEAALELQIGE